MQFFCFFQCGACLADYFQHFNFFNAVEVLIARSNNFYWFLEVIYGFNCVIISIISPFPGGSEYVSLVAIINLFFTLRRNSGDFKFFNFPNAEIEALNLQNRHPTGHKKQMDRGGKVAGVTKGNTPLKLRF